MNALLLALVGALTGLHAATWGGFKDSPFEGFRPSSFVRSVGLGLGCAIVLGGSGLLTSSSAVLVVVGLCYASERLVTEWWKAILREDRQSRYSIPMRLAVGGRPIDARLPRYAAGGVIAIGMVTAVVAASVLDVGAGDLPWWATLALVGVGGWLTAVGGAWKDAPVEGFELAKFFRSPAVATAWGCVLLPFSQSIGVLVVAAGGLSVVSIETYKTFLAGGPPGKFAGKREQFEVSATRDRCRRAHGVLYGVLVAVLATALLRPAGGVAGAQLARHVAELVAIVWASSCAALLLVTPSSVTVGRSRGLVRSAGPAGRQSDADLRGASS
jgi:hypothetical protein